MKTPGGISIPGDIQFTMVEPRIVAAHTQAVRWLYRCIGELKARPLNILPLHSLP
jgi:hypothetical protein